MRPKIVVGISGKMGTGKTTLADLLCQRIPGMTRVSFADALRQEVQNLYGVPMDWMKTQEGKDQILSGPKIAAVCEKPRATVRELLQAHGVFRRGADPDYWVKKLECDITKPGHFVIDDVRFSNEAVMVDRYGVLIRLEPFAQWRPGPHAGHVSETQLDGASGWHLVLRPAFGALKDLAPLLGDWLFSYFRHRECRARMRVLEEAA